jgi:hypothetical protein
MTGAAYRKLLNTIEQLTPEERMGVVRFIEDRIPKRRRTIGEYLRDWCVCNGTRLAQMRGRAKGAFVTAQRRALCAALHRQGFSSVEIGRALGRDHTTVLAAIATHERSKAGATRIVTSNTREASI